VALARRRCPAADEPGDDIWRYLWEGHIQTLGFNPFELAPTPAALVPLRTLVGAYQPPGRLSGITRR